MRLRGFVSGTDLEGTGLEGADLEGWDLEGWGLERVERVGYFDPSCREPEDTQTRRRSNLR